MSAMDLCCVPSLFEGLGITLIESQANGLKCIASDMIPDEACLEDYVKRVPLNINQWAEVICDFDWRYARMAPLNALKHAGYDIRLFIKQLEELYTTS